MPAPEIVGVVPGNTLRVGQFFRATLEVNAWSHLFFIRTDTNILADLQRAFDKIQDTGIVYTVSNFEGVPGDRTMVVDTAVSAAGAGVPVSALANELDHLALDLDLTRLELVSRDLVNSADSRRGETITANSDQSAHHPGLLAELEKLGTVLKWTIIGLIVIAIAYLAIRGGELVRKK